MPARRAADLAGPRKLKKLIAQEHAGAANDDFLEEVTGRQTADKHEDDDPSKQDGRKRRRGSFLENFLDFGGGYGVSRGPGRL